MVSIIHGTTHSTLLIGDMQVVMTHIGVIITIITTTIIMGIILITMGECIIQNQIGAIMWLVVMKMSVAMLIALHV